MSNYERLRSQPVLFRELTGMEVSEFDDTYQQLRHTLEYLPEITISKRKQARREYNYRTLSNRERLLMTLIWVKLSPSYAALGTLFKLDKKLVKRNVRLILNYVDNQETTRFARKHDDREARDLHEVVAIIPELVNLFEVPDEIKSVVQTQNYTPVTTRNEPGEVKVLRSELVASPGSQPLNSDNRLDFKSSPAGLHLDVRIKIIWILGVLIWLLGADWLYLYVNTFIGVLFHAVLVYGLLIYVGKRHRQFDLAGALLIPSIIRLTSVALPFASYDPALRYIITGLPLILAAFTAARSLHLSRYEMGVIPHLSLYQLILIPCGLLFGLIQHNLYPETITRLSSDRLYLILWVLAISFGGALAEEIAFRGTMQPLLRRVIGQWNVPFTALLYAGLMFVPLAHTHDFDAALSNTVFIFGVNLIWGWSAQYGRSLWGTVGSHIAMNLSVLFVLPVS